MMRMWIIVAALLFCFCGKDECWAGPRPLHTNAAPVSAAVTNSPIQKVGDGLFQIGQVRLDKEKRTITFPASVNMHEGNIEYVLVHATGKVHESLLKTSV